MITSNSPPNALLEPLGEPVALDRREEADGAEVDPEDRHAVGPVQAQRLEDRAVAAEHQAEVRALAGVGLDPGRGVAVLGELLLGGDQAPAGRAGARDQLA